MRPTTGQEPFAEALVRVERALREVVAGRHELFADLWSRAEDASLFGAFGPAKRGWNELEPVFPWVAGRYRDGTLAIDYVTVVESDEFAYTVGYERAVVSIDGATPELSTIRVTHVFRIEDGKWRLVHRHGDFTAGDDASIPGVSLAAEHSP